MHCTAVEHERLHLYQRQSTVVIHWYGLPAPLTSTGLKFSREKHSPKEKLPNFSVQSLGIAIKAASLHQRYKVPRPMVALRQGIQ